MEDNKNNNLFSKILYSIKNRFIRSFTSKKSNYTKISYVKICVLILLIFGIFFKAYIGHQKKSEDWERIRAPRQTLNGSKQGVPLFRNYVYGLSRQSIESQGNVTPCIDPDLNGNLCSKSPIEFIGYKWEQAFIFNQDHLESIFLYSDKLSGDDDSVILLNLMKNDYTPIYASNGKIDFDVLEYINNIGPDEAESELTKFISAAENNGDDIWISFFPNNFLKNIMSKNVHNITSLLKYAPEGIRTIEVYLSDELTSLKFETPIAEINSIKKRVKKEKF